jgi:hypothetical protein
MAPIYAINGLNGDIIKWREPELLPIALIFTLYS